MKWLDAARTRLRLLLDRRGAESRMNQEFRFHIEMETEQLMRAKGLAHDEARRQALVAFGGVEKHTEALRDGRGLAWLGGLSLDFKLSVRTLARYPGRDDRRRAGPGDRHRPRRGLHGARQRHPASLAATRRG